MLRSTFFGLEIAKTGLTVSQLGLDVTGHNIANVDTTGYTRQRIVSTAYDPFATLGKLLPVTQANVGGGVRIKILDQIRSAYLDSRFRIENTQNSYWQKRTETLTYLESYFDNVNEKTSINFSVARFFEAMKVLAEDTVEGAPRTQLQTAGKDLVQQLNSIYAGLVELQETQNKAVSVTVDDINRIASEIVELNKSIYGFEITGHMANDLRDKRNALLDELSKLVDIEYREYPDSYGQTELEVKINGELLVKHDKSWGLGVREAVNPVHPDEPPVLIPCWVKDRAEFNGAFLTISGTNVDYAVSRINDLAERINKLNEDVTAAADAVDAFVPAPVNPGDPGYDDYQAALEALDAVKSRREAGINQLMAIVPGATYSPGDLTLNTPVSISINGAELVSSDGTVTKVTIGEEQLGDLKINSGELQAYLDMRDGNGIGSNARGIPYYISMLNNLAKALAQEINAVHREGYYDHPVYGSASGVNFFEGRVQTLDADGKPMLDAGGNPIYTYFDDVSLITAKNISLSEKVTESAYYIACSTEQIISSGEPEELQRGNNKNMNNLYALFLLKNISLDETVSGRVGGVPVGSFDSYATSIRFDVGNTLNNAKKTAVNSNTLMLAAENQRMSIAGVSLDEEMTFMIKYQHAYNGAARVITTMDEMLDKLINGTGRVGL